MSGKTIIVTGASAGIGYEVARVLCEGGNDVILACRSEEKTNICIEKIKKQNPSALATFMQVCLRTFKFLFLLFCILFIFVCFSPQFITLSIDMSEAIQKLIT